jgi:hypothetical protein
MGVGSMKLIIDEKKGSYYYVDELDESIRLSPRFDYLEDAEQWKSRMTYIMNKLLDEDKYYEQPKPNL